MLCCLHATPISGWWKSPEYTTFCDFKDNAPGFMASRASLRNFRQEPACFLTAISKLKDMIFSVYFSLNTLRHLNCR